MLRGSDFTRSLRRKVLDLDLWGGGGAFSDATDAFRDEWFAGSRRFPDLKFPKS